VLLPTAGVDAAVGKRNLVAADLEPHRGRVKLVMGIAPRLLDIRDPHPG
jgi:hypothetical protein